MKILATSLALIMVFGATSCGSSETGTVSSRSDISKADSSSVTSESDDSEATTSKEDENGYDTSNIQYSEPYQDALTFLDKIKEKDWDYVVEHTYTNSAGNGAERIKEFTDSETDSLNTQIDSLEIGYIPNSIGKCYNTSDEKNQARVVVYGYDLRELEYKGGDKTKCHKIIYSDFLMQYTEDGKYKYETDYLFQQLGIQSKYDASNTFHNVLFTRNFHDWDIITDPDFAKGASDIHDKNESYNKYYDSVSKLKTIEEFFNFCKDNKDFWDDEPDDDDWEEYLGYLDENDFSTFDSELESVYAEDKNGYKTGLTFGYIREMESMYSDKWDANYLIAEMEKANVWTKLKLAGTTTEYLYSDLDSDFILWAYSNAVEQLSKDDEYFERISNSEDWI